MSKATSYRDKTRSSMWALMRRSEEKDLLWQLLIAVGVLMLATLLVAIALLLTEGRGGGIRSS